MIDPLKFKIQHVQCLPNDAEKRKYWNIIRCSGSEKNEFESCYRSHEIFEKLFVPHAGLGLTAQAGHGLDTLKGVVALGSLTGQHDTIGTIQDGIGHIGTLSTGTSGLLHHGLQHLCGANDRFASLRSILKK
jgi:hypothetical protein